MISVADARDSVAGHQGKSASVKIWERADIVRKFALAKFRGICYFSIFPGPSTPCQYFAAARAAGISGDGQEGTVAAVLILLFPFPTSFVSFH